MKEKIAQLAEELYNWSGRYGAHGGVLWKDARASNQRGYIVEAKFILREFIEKLFDYRSLSLLKEEIKKVENPYSKAKLASAEYYEGEGFDKACQAILKILEI